MTVYAEQSLAWQPRYTCHRASKSAFVYRILAEGWDERPGREQAEGSGTVTRVQADPGQLFVLFVTVRAQWSCLYAGVWKHWHVTCQPAACQRLTSFASSDRQFTVPVMFFSFFFFLLQFTFYIRPFQLNWLLVDTFFVCCLYDYIYSYVYSITGEMRHPQKYHCKKIISRFVISTFCLLSNQLR